MSPRGFPRPFHQRKIKFLYSLSVGFYTVSSGLIFADSIMIAGILGGIGAVLVACQELTGYHEKIASRIGWNLYLTILVILPIVPFIFKFLIFNKPPVGQTFGNKGL